MQVVTNWSVTVNEWASLAQPGNCLVVDLWVLSQALGICTGIAISGIKPEERIARSYFGNIPAELPYRADAPTGIEV